MEGVKATPLEQAKQNVEKLLLKLGGQDENTSNT